MTFSENQVRHLYVGKELNEVKKGAKVGTIKPKVNDDKSLMWFEYMGVGGASSSDKISLKNLVNAKATESKSMVKTLNRYKIELSDVQPTVVAGQDYLLRVAFRQYIGMSDEDQYWKYGMVHGIVGMTPDTFYKTLAVSLAKNISRDENKLMKIYVHSAGTTSGSFDSHGLCEVDASFSVKGGANDATNNWNDGSSPVKDIDYILLEEVEQPWILGRVSSEKIPFTVQPDVITVSGSDIIWGEVTKETPKEFIQNGKLIADLEYFCMGERGDIYRSVGYPDIINTQYLVDASKKYDVLDITYFYAGNHEDIQKSQKVITIVAEDDGSHTLMNQIVGDINGLSTDLNIDTL